MDQLYNYSTVFEAAIKCKPYSEITVEIRTHLKTVKIISNIFAVRNSIDASLFTYLCIAICIVICISADECIL